MNLCTDRLSHYLSVFFVYTEIAHFQNYTVSCEASEKQLSVEEFDSLDSHFFSLIFLFWRNPRSGARKLFSTISRPVGTRVIFGALPVGGIGQQELPAQVLFCPYFSLFLEQFAGVLHHY